MTSFNQIPVLSERKNHNYQLYFYTETKILTNTKLKYKILIFGKTLEQLDHFVN